MANPFAWLLRRMGVRRDTRELCYLCHAFQDTRDRYESARNAPPVLMRQNKDSPSEQMRREKPRTFNDRVFAPDFNTILLAELALQADLRDVRIHTGPEAEAMARRAGADAFASGNDIYFREGMYEPHTEEGKNLLIHELQHVAQYRKGQTPEYMEDRDALEYDASKKESSIAGRDLHTLERSELSDEEGSSHSERESGMDGASSDLRDFGKKKTEYIRVIDKTGKSYLLTPEERQEVIRKATELVEDRLTAEWDYMDKKKKGRIMHNLKGRQGGYA